MSGSSYNTNSGYETRDVNVFTVTVLIILGIIALAGILVSLDIYFSYTVEREIYEIVLKPGSKALKEIRQRDRLILDSYGKSDSLEGVYRIPIDSAMRDMLREAPVSKNK